jgi:hypothetical protein
VGDAGHQHLTFEFEGPTLAATLGRAVEVFAESVADVHPSLVAATHDVELAGSTPSALLLAVLEECLRRGREGEVAVTLDATVADGVLHGVVGTVPAADPHVEAAMPHVVSWHEVCLEPDGERGAWRGRVCAARA